VNHPVSTVQCGYPGWSQFGIEFLLWLPASSGWKVVTVAQEVTLVSEPGLSWLQVFVLAPHAVGQGVPSFL
jgi:hypothetical protein